MSQRKEEASKNSREVDTAAEALNKFNRLMNTSRHVA